MTEQNLKNFLHLLFLMKLGFKDPLTIIAVKGGKENTIN